MPSQRRKTALSFLAAFENLDTNKFTTLLSPTYTHIFRPSSQPATQNSTQFLSHIQKLQKVISQFPVWPNEIYEDEAQNKIIIWAGGEAFFKDEYKDEGWTREEWTYVGEYMFVFSFDEEGKIERTVEFLDSKAADHARGLMQRARANLQRMEEGKE